MQPVMQSFRGHVPATDRAAFIAPGAALIGNVTVGKDSSIWYGCVVRADLERIEIGDDVNVQDGALLHADPGLPVSLGDRVSLGHGAIVHGAVVESDTLIGMRATVLNGARIGSGSVVAAGAVVRPGMIVPPNSLVAGVPATIIRPAGDAERDMITQATETYRELAVEHDREVYRPER